MNDTLTSNMTIHQDILDEMATYEKEEPVTCDMFTLQPEALVDMAMERLSAAGVQLIEWRALLYRRLNIPIIAKVCPVPRLTAQIYIFLPRTELLLRNL
jgi:hypothetical protein